MHPSAPGLAVYPSGQLIRFITCPSPKMKFSERMQTYASAMTTAYDRDERCMTYLALYLLEMYTEDLVDGEAHAWEDVTIPEVFRARGALLLPPGRQGVCRG